jgi:hypothetical protein
LHWFLCLVTPSERDEFQKKMALGFHLGGARTYGTPHSWGVTLHLKKHCQKFHSVFGVHLRKVRFTRLHWRDLIFLTRNISFWNVCLYKMTRSWCFRLDKALGWGHNQNASTTSAITLSSTLVLLMPSSPGLMYHFMHNAFNIGVPIPTFIRMNSIIELEINLSEATFSRYYCIQFGLMASKVKLVFPWGYL